MSSLVRDGLLGVKEARDEKHRAYDADQAPHELGRPCQAPGRGGHEEGHERADHDHRDADAGAYGF